MHRQIHDVPGTALTVIEALQKRSTSAGLQRAKAVYTVYRNRWDAFAAVRAQIPEDTRVLVHERSARRVRAEAGIGVVAPRSEIHFGISSLVARLD